MAAGGWFAGKPLLARYYISCELVSAGDESDVNYSAIAGLGGAAVPRLLRVLQHEPAPAERAAKALALVVEKMPADDPRVVAIASQLAAAFSDLSPAGRRAGLQHVIDPILVRCPSCKDSCHDMGEIAMKD